MNNKTKELNDDMLWLNSMAKETGQLLYFYNPETGNVKWVGAVEEITGYTPKEYVRGLNLISDFTHYAI